MKKTKLLFTIVSAIVVLVVIFLVFNKKNDEEAVEVNVKFGKFEIVVTTTGELKSENSVNVLGPEGLRTLRLWNVKISDLIPEGTVVDSGAYVAMLDKSEAVNNLKDVESELQKIESQYIKTQLDTTLTLRSLRDDIQNLKYQLEETKILVEQSQYEPPATIRQVKITLEKSQRTYEQTLDNYKLKVKQAKAQMQEVAASLEQQKRKRENIADILKQFEIRAPKNGMVIYAKDWNGVKKKVGSMVSAWEPIIAEMPDLSSMISHTYINEIDISKVKMNQVVNIGVDAFPEKRYTGKVIEIANVGQQLPNTDVKVFKVLIKLNETDSILRPAMTSSNAILTGTFENVLYIPLDAVHAADSITYVYKKQGFSVVKQIIKTGESNENETIVTQGLKKDDVLLLSVPEDDNELEFSKIVK